LSSGVEKAVDIDLMHVAHVWSDPLLNPTSDKAQLGKIKATMANRILPGQNA